MFFMCMSLITVYTPCAIYFFCYNVNITWLSYDWGIIHDPNIWNIVIYIPFSSKHMADKSVAIVMTVLLVCFYGFASESRNMYRRAALRLGLGRLFSSLANPSRRRGSNERRGLLARFSLVKRAKGYFGSSRNNSTATTTGMGTQLDTTFTK
jgi:hypothetical protein